LFTQQTSNGKVALRAKQSKGVRLFLE
jgi:hypothetical protein